MKKMLRQYPKMLRLSPTEMLQMLRVLRGCYANSVTHKCADYEAFNGRCYACYTTFPINNKKVVLAYIAYILYMLNMLNAFFSARVRECNMRNTFKN